MGFFGPNVEKMKAKRDVEGLIKAFEHKDWRVRWDAAEALGEVGDARAVETLIQAIKVACPVGNKFLDDNRVQVLEPIGGLGLGQGVVVFGRVALPALCRIGEPAVEPLIQALKDEDKRVRLGAARVLGDIGDGRAIEPLTKSLKDRNKDVREAAKEALEHLEAQKS